MTVTEAIIALQKLQMAGHGNLIVSCVGDLCYCDSYRDIEVTEFVAVAPAKFPAGDVEKLPRVIARGQDSSVDHYELRL